MSLISPYCTLPISLPHCLAAQAYLHPTLSFLYPSYIILFYLNPSFPPVFFISHYCPLPTTLPYCMAAQTYLHPTLPFLYPSYPILFHLNVSFPPFSLILRPTVLLPSLYPTTYTGVHCMWLLNPTSMPFYLFYTLHIPSYYILIHPLLLSHLSYPAVSFLSLYHTI